MKSRFRQPIYELLTVTIVTGFLIVNLVRLVTNPTLVQLFPIALQSTIMIFYLLKHKYLAISIKVWSVLFVVGASLTIIALALGGFSEMDYSKFLWVAVDLIVGVVLWLIASSEIETIAITDLINRE